MEIFSSFQGEGTHVGESTVFVRFGGCDLRCRWCDSPHTWKRAPVCRIEERRGSGRFAERPNPVPLTEVMAACEALDLAAHRFASLTGGEPLLQPEAARALARALRERGPRVLLETHGAAPEALARVVDAVDVVSMDWKLASDVRREAVSFREPGAPFDAEHEAFLEIARRAPELVVKVVLTPASGDAELERMSEAVARRAPAATLVLQPVTPCGGVAEAPSAARLLELQARLERRHERVLVLPQTHKAVGAP